MQKFNQLAIMTITLSMMTSAIFATGALDLETYNPGPTTSEQTGLRGHVILVQSDEEGNIKAYRQTDNIITYTGLSCAAMELFGKGLGNTTASENDGSTGNVSEMCGGGGTASGTFDYVGIGTSSTSEVIGDSGALTGAFARVQDTSVGIVNGTTGNPGPTYAIIQSQFGTGISGTIAEAGLFDGSDANGHLFARKTFTGIPMGTEDTLTVTWRVTLA